VSGIGIKGETGGHHGGSATAIQVIAIPWMAMRCLQRRILTALYFTAQNMGIYYFTNVAYLHGTQSERRRLPSDTAMKRYL